MSKASSITEPILDEQLPGEITVYFCGKPIILRRNEYVNIPSLKGEVMSKIKKDTPTVSNIYSDHKCKYGGCLSDVVHSDLTFCENHKCVNEECQYIKRNRSEWCKEHSCCIVGCTNYIEDTGYCKKHTCTWPNCNEMNSFRSTFCYKHGCRQNNCPKTKYSLHSHYCQDHTCPEENCFGVSMISSGYCKIHTCWHEGCFEKMVDNSKYCADHYLVEHKCQYNECLENVIHANRPYCETHKCSNEECEEIKKNMSNWCENHTCHKLGCANYTSMPLYCKDHKCVVNNCKHAKDYQNELCYAHKYKH